MSHQGESNGEPFPADAQREAAEPPDDDAQITRKVSSFQTSTSAALHTTGKRQITVTREKIDSLKGPLHQRPEECKRQQWAWTLAIAAPHGGAQNQQTYRKHTWGLNSTKSWTKWLGHNLML